MLQSNRNNAGTRGVYQTAICIRPYTRIVVYIRPSATRTTASLLLRRRKLLPTDTGARLVRQNDGQSPPRVILHAMTALAGKHAGDDPLRHVTMLAGIESRFLPIAADPSWAPGYCTRAALTPHTCLPNNLPPAVVWSRGTKNWFETSAPPWEALQPSVSLPKINGKYAISKQAIQDTHTC